MNFKGVIFDLDGVLCFTDRYHYRAWKALADRLGIYFDEKINDRLRGVSMGDISPYVPQPWLLLGWLYAAEPAFPD